MQHQYITYYTGLLAKKVGINVFNWGEIKWGYSSEKQLFKAHNRPIDYDFKWDLQFLKDNWDQDYIVLACTQEVLNKWIREERGVHIMINRNASGYFWEMMKSDSGTDLGYSRTSGPNAGGAWDTYEGALENGMAVQLNMDLPLNPVLIKHWGNYASEAIEKFKR